MGAAASSIIDDLHTSAQMPDEIAAERKVSCLKQVQELGRDAPTAVQIIEQGGIQPLLQCYNATHPLVRVEAAKALAVLAQQPENQVEMGVDEILPRYHPALLTASHEFCEHAMALLAALAMQEANRMKIVHEGLLSPIIHAITAPHERLRANALDALAKLCEASQIAVLATQRGVLPHLLRAARSTDPTVKLAVIKVLTGIGRCGENMSAFITSGAAIFLMGCTYCGPEVQLAVAHCLEGVLQQVYEGRAEMHEREAAMLATMTQLEVSPERISEADPMEFDVHSAMEMPLVELIPEIVARIKQLINCDRASVFIRQKTEGKDELTTILADGLEQITIPVDMHSIAGECAVQGSLLNLRKAHERENFNRDVDRKTGYTTRSMLVVPIRRVAAGKGGGAGEGDEEDEEGAEHAQHAAASTEPPIGIIQCINKLGAPVGDNVDDEGAPTFSPEDERRLDTFCRKFAPVLEKISYKKRQARKANQLTSDWVANIGTLASLDIDSVLKVSLERVRDLVAADRASLFIHDKKRKQLWTRLAHGMDEVRLPSNSGIVGAVCTSGEPLNIPDAYKDPRFNRRIDTASGYRTRTILCVPLKNQRDDIVGVVQVINKLSGSLFTAEDEASLTEFCWQIASVLEFKTSASSASASSSARVATGDAIGLLLHLLQQQGEPGIQLHAACCIGHLSVNEANRERIVALGGVPIILELGMPWPWRERRLLRGISRAMGHLTASPTVRAEVAHRGGWKSILALAQTADPEVWFDALRALANLAMHAPPAGARGAPLSRAMLEAGALEVAMSFLSRPKAPTDLKVQAVRLAGNLSGCCRDGADAWATKQFSRGDVIRRLGDAASEAADAARDALGGKVGAGETLTDFAAAYARLSRVPAVALWLFDVVGVTILEAFADATGPTADDVRAQLGSILASCLRERQNQRIVLDMLRSNDPTEASFRGRSTTEQRLLMLRERDALRTGKEVRGIMTRLLRSPSTNPAVFTQYARILQMLAEEPSNHSYMLMRHDVSSYIEQLVLLASPAQEHHDARAAALRGLRLLAEARVVDGILRILTGQMRIVPILMYAVQLEHDETRVEVCRLVRALAHQPEIADDMIRSSHPILLTGMRLQVALLEQQAAQQQQQQAGDPQQQTGQTGAVVAAGADAARPDGGAKPPAPTKATFLTLLGALLASPAADVLMEACLALESLARDHKVEMCQAKVVGMLIALISHSGGAKDEALVQAAGRVLRLLAQERVSLGQMY